MHLARTDPGFGALERASIKFTDDNVNGKESFKVSLVAGLAVEFDDGRGQIVPYFGATFDASTKDGQPREISTDIYRIGSALSYRWLTPQGTTHWFVVRPEFAANRVEHSEVVSGNFTYMPVGTLRLGGAAGSGGAINLPLNRPVPILGNVISIMPQLDFRFNVGHFRRRGTRPIERSHDFVRVGGQIGISLFSNLEWLPAELNVTETWLHALDGYPDDLSQLRAVLSLPFDAKKYFSLDFSYVRGQREDLLAREDTWTVGFGAKF